ncbi:MAG TPA: tetratricopeptide repeat protein [Verrucomicrobiae bacterium]|nr:tetratricopeptide repeat protein [Verrucomicrobiae bacterium]
MAWLLSGQSSSLIVSRKTELARRGIRCAVTLLFVEAGLWILRHDLGLIGLLFFLAVAVLPLMLMWGGAVTELLAGIFHDLVDSNDNREFDPDKRMRDMDAIAQLIREGRKDAAIQLCRELKKSGDASVMAMDTILEQLGVPQTSDRPANPLLQADQLRKYGQFQEAQLILKSLLFKNPANVEAAAMLARLYAQDMKQSDKARTVLEHLKKQPHISEGHLEFIARSIYEWENPPPKEVAEEKLPDSVDELIAKRYFGTAIELLEQQIQAQPESFDLRLRLAEAQCVHCNNFSGAEKIVKQMESEERFSRAQIRSAYAKLKEWKQQELPLLKR